jgi:beta-lactam-binding protein with PASTA domain
VALPDVRGQYEAQARSALERAGFKVETDRHPSRERAPGMIADQTPPPGTPVTPGSTVAIGVSSGPPRPVSVRRRAGTRPW